MTPTIIMMLLMMIIIIVMIMIIGAARRVLRGDGGALQPEGVHGPEPVVLDDTIQYYIV